MAAGKKARGEVERRQRVARTLATLRRERIEQPQLPVKAPVAIVNQDWERLPVGVHLEPGQLTIEFREPQEALKKLLALAMALSNDFEQFEQRTRRK